MRWPSITRRGLFRGAATAAAVGAVIGILPGCTHNEGEDVPEPMVVDAGRSVNMLEEFEEIELKLKEGDSWSVPLGSVLHEATGSWAAVTQAGTSASPMVKGCAFSLVDGSLKEVVPDVIGDGHTRVIYDVSCSDEVYAWVELDYITHAWTLYAARFDARAGALDATPTTLWEGDADFDPPGFVCVDDMVLWQIMPALKGTKTSEHSFCYLWRVGATSAKSVVESPGRFAFAPSVSKDVVILAPRVRASEGQFYGVTAYSLADDLATVVDTLVLPQTVRPFYATRVGERFAVSVEANYSSGGMFGSMGTYIGPGNGPFFRITREPSANVCGYGDTFVIKSRTSYFVVDLSKTTYGILTAANRCVDYGEFPVRVGESRDFVTFATVKDEASGYPASVTVRTFGL